MTDSLGPTKEQLRKAVYEPPIVNQDTNRKAWRKISVFEELHNRGELEYHQLRAAEKFEKHWHGAHGANVRMSDEESSGNVDVEYARTYHAQKLADAADQLRAAEFLALEEIVKGRTVESVGRKWRPGNRMIARAQGLVLIFEGLEVLAVHWGLASN